MTASSRVALVTGANRGIGLAIARRLHEAGLAVILAARDLGHARRAAQGLGNSERMRVVALDVTDPASVASLPDQLDRLDVLVNNAGVVLDAHVPSPEADLEIVRQTLETNLYGPWNVVRHTLPLLRRSRSGRIVNVSSGMGQLAEMGGGSPGYRTSKAALNALTRMLAADLRDDGILVNAACPGWVRTDMGGPRAPRRVAQGADTPAWLALLDDDGPTGGFFRDRQPIPW